MFNDRDWARYICRGSKSSTTVGGSEMRSVFQENCGALVIRLAKAIDSNFRPNGHEFGSRCDGELLLCSGRYICRGAKSSTMVSGNQMRRVPFFKIEI